MLTVARLTIGVIAPLAMSRTAVVSSISEQNFTIANWSELVKDGNLKGERGLPPTKKR